MTIRNFDPLAGLFSIVMVPPKSSIRFRNLYSPIPMPVPYFFEVKKGSKIRSCAFLSIPHPLSSISITRRSLHVLPVQALSLMLSVAAPEIAVSPLDIACASSVFHLSRCFPSICKTEVEQADFILDTISIFPVRERNTTKRVSVLRILPPWSWKLRITCLPLLNL